MIPHVTQFDEADITELEALRKESNEATKKDGVKVTHIGFSDARVDIGTEEISRSSMLRWKATAMK